MSVCPPCCCRIDLRKFLKRNTIGICIFRVHFSGFGKTAFFEVNHELNLVKKWYPLLCPQILRDAREMVGPVISHLRGIPSAEARPNPELGALKATSAVAARQFVVPASGRGVVIKLAGGAAATIYTARFRGSKVSKNHPFYTENLAFCAVLWTSVFVSVRPPPFAVL